MPDFIDLSNVKANLHFLIREEKEDTRTLMLTHKKQGKSEGVLKPIKKEVRTSTQLAFGGSLASVLASSYSELGSAAGFCGPSGIW
jgi:hypothetical protein